MTVFVVAHGAWSGGWSWVKMRPLLRAAGHDLVTPTYTGLGEREHLAHPAIDVDTHITDITNVLTFEDLNRVILIGHSYGGMVATGVADRVPDRVSRLVYLDAFIPRDGQSLTDIQPPIARERMREATASMGEGWRVPPNPLPPDTSEADAIWFNARRRPQPLATFERPISLTHSDGHMPRSFIRCARVGPHDTFRQFAERARTEAGWTYVDFDASHNPHITVPTELAAIMCEMARDQGGAPRVP